MFSLKSQYGYSKDRQYKRLETPYSTHIIAYALSVGLEAAVQSIPLSMIEERRRKKGRKLGAYGFSAINHVGGHVMKSG